MPHTKNFNKFPAGKDIEFNEITKSLLERYKAFLKGSKNVSE
jgi:hypothetical protein